MVQGDQATERTSPKLPLTTSQILTVSSLDPDANCTPSGQATQFTKLSCPRNVAVHWPEASSINEDRVKTLLLSVVYRVESITRSARLPLLPHTLPESRMPPMINMQPYTAPTPTQLALTGLASVYLYGLPEYAALRAPKEETPLVRLCIPLSLAENSFTGQRRRSQQKTTIWRTHFSQTQKNYPFTAPHLKAGPVVTYADKRPFIP